MLQMILDIAQGAMGISATLSVVFFLMAISDPHPIPSEIFGNAAGIALVISGVLLVISVVIKGI